MILREGLLAMLIAFAVLLIYFFGAVCALWAISQGEPPPFRDQAGRILTGSISEKLHVNINGVAQGMFVTRGQNQASSPLPTRRPGYAGVCIQRKLSHHT